MSTPAHLWLGDENGSPIIGSCLMPLRLGSIELKSFFHGVTVPIDPSQGKFTGTRVHRPITIVEELDRITPLLYRAVCEGRTLKKATIKMYRILESASRPSISISFWKTSNSQPWRLIWRLAVCVVRILKRLNYAMRRLPGSIQTVILSIAIHGAIAAVPDNFLHNKS